MSFRIRNTVATKNVLIQLHAAQRRNTVEKSTAPKSLSWPYDVGAAMRIAIVPLPELKTRSELALSCRVASRPAALRNRMKPSPVPAGWKVALAIGDAIGAFFVNACMANLPWNRQASFPSSSLRCHSARPFRQSGGRHDRNRDCDNTSGPANGALTAGGAMVRVHTLRSLEPTVHCVWRSRSASCWSLQIAQQWIARPHIPQVTRSGIAGDSAMFPLPRR
jgi:hypothetical protein